jgi:hypothetical protein
VAARRQRATIDHATSPHTPAIMKAARSRGAQ